MEAPLFYEGQANAPQFKLVSPPRWNYKVVHCKGMPTQVELDSLAEWDIVNIAIDFDRLIQYSQRLPKDESYTRSYIITCRQQVGIRVVPQIPQKVPMPFGWVLRPVPEDTPLLPGFGPAAGVVSFLLTIIAGCLVYSTFFK